MARINMRGLEAEIAQKGYKIYKPLVEDRVKRMLQKETQQVLNAFNQNAVTKEIEAGPNSSNISNTLGGYGNLFTFIGFESGSDPITPIRSLLAKSIQIRAIRKKRNTLALKLTFSVPTLEQIKAVTPSPWSTDSWAEAIERGMSGLGKYLHASESGKFKKSRSGRGVQTSVEIRSVSNSSPVEYMTKILEDMLRSIESSLKRL